MCIIISTYAGICFLSLRIVYPIRHPQQYASAYNYICWAPFAYTIDYNYIIIQALRHPQHSRYTVPPTLPPIANTIGSETIEVVNVVMNNMENYLPRAAVQQAYAK